MGGRQLYEGITRSDCTTSSTLVRINRALVLRELQLLGVLSWNVRNLFRSQTLCKFKGLVPMKEIAPHLQWMNKCNKNKINKSRIIKVNATNNLATVDKCSDRHLFRELKQRRFWATHVNRMWDVFSLKCFSATKFEMLKVFSLIETICRNFGQNHNPRMQMVYFRLTCVTQKCLCLSSILTNICWLKIVTNVHS